jgi:hypothetical protein
MTMTTVRLLVFDDELLSRSKSGTVWGRIFFDLGAQSFPDNGWSDLVVVVTNAWIEGLLRIKAHTTETTKVSFMDGPLLVSISPTGSGLVQLDFIHKDCVKHSAITSFDELLQDAISAGKNLLDICRHHGWSSDPDYIRLVANVERGIRLLPV